MEDITARQPREPLVPPGGLDRHERDMTATLSADLTLNDVQKKLGEIEQWLPIDGDGLQSIGQLVSRNSTGPLRLGYGAWRDLLLGAQFLNGKGELISAGGRTVKNVAGYDLTKFMVGQAGVFGRLVTVTTRTYRKPVGSILAHFKPDLSLVAKLLASSQRPQWMMLTINSLWCGYLGDEPTLAYYLEAATKLPHIEANRRPLNDDIAFRAATWTVVPTLPSFRASVPPARLMDFVNTSKAKNWVADAAFGVVIGSADASARSAISLAAKNVGGSVAFYSEDGAPLSGPRSPVERAVLERLKLSFDPEGALNPLPKETENAP